MLGDRGMSTLWYCCVCRCVYVSCFVFASVCVCILFSVCVWVSCFGVCVFLVLCVCVYLCVSLFEQPVLIVCCWCVGLRCVFKEVVHQSGSMRRSQRLPCPLYCRYVFLCWFCSFLLLGFQNSLSQRWHRRQKFNMPTSISLLEAFASNEFFVYIVCFAWVVKRFGRPSNNVTRAAFIFARSVSKQQQQHSSNTFACRFCCESRCVPHSWRFWRCPWPDHICSGHDR